MFQTNVVENIPTTPSLATENHAIYEIMLENIIEPDRSRMAIYTEHAFALSWISRAIDTH